MTTAPDLAPNVSRQPEPNHPRLARRGAPVAVRGLAVSLLIGLVGFNGWWFARERHPVPTLETAQHALGQGHFAEAERLLRERLRTRPRDATAMVALARARAGLNDLLGCARILRRVPDWSGQRPEALYRAGQSFFQVDHAREAEACWLELIHEDPLHPVMPELYTDACSELLKLYAVEDRWQDAFPVIWSAYDRTSGVDQLGWLVSRMRPELERVSHLEARTHLIRYLAADPDDIEARRALAKAELALGHRPEAEAQFLECRKRDPEQVRVWRDFLTMLLEQGDQERLVDLLDHPPRSADLEPETWFFRGMMAEKQGEWAQAKARFQKAIELHPFTPKYYFRLAAVENRLGEHASAAIHRKRTQQMNDARAQLASAYNDFLASQAPEATPKRPVRATAARRLGSICETLGWARAAQAWNRLAVEL